MPWPGPDVLGRGVVVEGDAPAPAAWNGAGEVTVDEGVVDDPRSAVGALHDAWLARRPVVVRLRVDPGAFREPEVVTAPVWAVAPEHDLARDRLHHLVWANTYDARSGEPVWWWGRKAARVGANETPDGAADVVVDGAPAWVDGGPRATAPTITGADVIHAEHVVAGSLATVPVRSAVAPALAADQLAAVTASSGAIRVVAPAGSGKTRVLTERVRHLLGTMGYHRSTVLAVAYNKKAQEQLAERLADVSPRTSTLNALGYAILAQHRGRRPSVLDEPDVRRLVDDVFPIPRQRRANTDPVAPYLDAMTAVRLGLRDPAEVEAERDDVPGLAGGFDEYRRRLADRGVIDFDEQIYAAVEALLRDGAFRRGLQPGHAHLLVDEFQDLTPAHVLMLRLLATPGFDVFGVGDDDQTIYDHAGADPRFLIGFDQLFPGAGHAALEINHRCPAVVVAAADRVLQRNRRRVAKVIRPGPDAATGDDLLSIVAHSSDGGARALVEVVRGWLDDGDRPEQVAVLTRVNSLLLAPAVALREAGVPVATTLGPEVLDRTGVSAALAWLRIADDPGALDPADLSTVARRPSRGFPRWIDKWFSRCRSVHEVARIVDRIDDERVAGKVADLAHDLERISAQASRSTRAVLEVVRDDIGLGGAMQLLDGSKGGQTASHLDDLEALLQVADLHPEPEGFEAWLRDVLRRRDQPGGVALATIHRVKGREWPSVALFGLARGIVPHRLAEDVEAERRVFHVGLTRCRARVALLGPSDRLSRFVGEIQRDPADDPAEAPARRADETPAARPRDVPRIPAAPGRRLEVLGGYAGEVESVSAEGVQLRLDRGGTLFVRFGERVRSEGRPGELVSEGHDSTAVARAEEALRTWRLERSRADAVPAFVVLSDAHLHGIAQRLPSDAAALRRCPGIGPTKLERYGDDILEVLDAATSG